MIQAGLATIIAGNQGNATLPSLAMGALAGQEAGKAARADAVKRQTQAQLQQALQENGFDRESMTRTFFTMLASGDIEGAKSVSEIIKSLPDPSPGANRQAVDTVISATAGAPEAVVARLGEGRKVSVQRDARTGQIYWDSAVPAQPEEQSEFDMYDANSPTGRMRVRVVDGAIVPLAPTPDAGGAGGEVGGGAEERRRMLLGGITKRNLEMAFSDPEGLSNMLTGTLARWSEGRSVMASGARWALGQLRPEAQVAQAGRQMAMATLTPLLSGAAMTDTERQYYGTAFMIQENDLPATALAKQAAVMALAEAFEQGVLIEDGPNVTDRDRAHNRQVMQQIMQETLLATPPAGASAPAAGAPAAASGAFPDFRPR
jgi:hypothetical protein